MYGGKMKFDVLTLFPEMFEPIKQSVIGRAKEKGVIEINLINIRDFSKDKHKKVDDTPYGGGAGMVLMPQPYIDAYNSVEKFENSITLMMTPQGEPFTDQISNELAYYNQIIILCGHYEGFDERIKTLADEIISVGDFVLTGGEIPAMLITDSIIRLLPGAITNESLESESFNENLLDYPVYTKPAVYRDMNVPDILLSGDHKKIDDYRESERIRLTKEKRPDLLK